MDAQELRNLQEAYLEVVMNELDEGYKKLPVGKMIRKAVEIGGKSEHPSGRLDTMIAGQKRGAKMGKVADEHNPSKVKRKEAENRAKETKTESIDIYDIILSHLLDEGYAETPEAAEAIMVNMSEEWKQDIMEISQKTATSAYAQRRTGEFEGDDASDRVAKTNKLKGRIEKKFGAKAGEHADRAADVKTFGRKDASGRRKQSPQPRIQTSDHENQREFKRELRIRRDRRLRAAEDN